MTRQELIGVLGRCGSQGDRHQADYIESWLMFLRNEEVRGDRELSPAEYLLLESLIGKMLARSSEELRFSTGRNSAMDLDSLLYRLMARFIRRELPEEYRAAVEAEERELRNQVRKEPDLSWAKGVRFK